MQDEYYGDKRDLLKWGAIVNYCTKHKVKTVLQITFGGEKEWSPSFKENGKPVPIKAEVMRHFRCMENIQLLGRAMSLEIEIIRSNNEARQLYLEHAVKAVKRSRPPKVVFLDPDTGLAAGKVTKKHVSREDVSRLWDTIQSGDLLVLYQHRFRKSDWKISRRREFAKACGIPVSAVGQWTGPKVASDVALFYATKR